MQKKLSNNCGCVRNVGWLLFRGYEIKVTLTKIHGHKMKSRDLTQNRFVAKKLKSWPRNFFICCCKMKIDWIMYNFHIFHQFICLTYKIAVLNEPVFHLLIWFAFITFGTSNRNKQFVEKFDETNHFILIKSIFQMDRKSYKIS